MIVYESRIKIKYANILPHLSVQMRKLVFYSKIDFVVEKA